jgi:hypothetical protein
MMRKFGYSLATALLLSLAVFAQDGAVAVTGNIVDKNCSARGGDHPKDCSLKEGCAKSGFGVYADGKWTAFDDKGNGLAKAALEKSAKAKGAKFKVTGKLADGKIAVDSISEVE